MRSDILDRIMSSGIQFRHAMSEAISQPIYCITSDIDWASSYCIEDFLGLCEGFGVIPTLFATHNDPIIKRFAQKNPHDVGMHPNFRANSSHGETYISVIDHLFDICPGAKTFRSHSFYDSSEILQEMFRRGVVYDSNICLYLQPNLVPLRLGTADITRFPVFWEDDCHWQCTGADWNFTNYIPVFTSPGLKIINVHPFLLAADIPSSEYYFRVKKHIPSLTRENIDDVRHKGDGVRTFFIDMIDYLKSHNYPFFSLWELFNKYPIQLFISVAQ